MHLQAQRNDAVVAAQHRRMLLALVILLATIVVMVAKDHTIWFGGEEISAGDETPNASQPGTAPVPTQATQVTAPAPVIQAKRQESAKAPAKAVKEATSVVATERKALPPLQVEVVAGGSHRAIQPETGVVKVDLQSDSVMSANQLAPVTNAAERTRLPLDKTLYPPLAGRMNVQGSVLLEALIGVDGIIKDLRVISGPLILSSAARVAALQWHFKPYVQNGKAVETEARITVNFLIKVSDDKAATARKNPPQLNSQPVNPGN